MNRINYKTRNKALLIAFPLFAWVIYSMGINNTLELRSQYKMLEEKAMLAQDAPLKVQKLESRLAGLNRISTTPEDHSANFQQKLLGTITGFCLKNNLVIRSIPTIVKTSESDLEIETNVFVVEGSFVRLLNLVYLLEKAMPGGKIKSVHYQAKKDYKTKTTSLTATIYLQNIKQKELNEN